ncbi:hypothetical protein DSC45_31510 [Streptomyces sp. YIM 130001]|uniref:hypothetical protein n=1 Tax=Streptomyces sp. YIM 130001 TaxID=2259644 RepID=UPI000E65A6DE|nr:hypothetical protein [Streptomyces sp. YIM 130001]RII09406.1 hypothetical protein DSC45_31510 [Streptomyces sp. YIM 130001]
MAGTDEAVAADEDALFVLTATLLTPPQFPSVLGDDYPEACAALGLVPLADGYGLVLGQDSDGARWTVVVDDVSLVAVAIASWDCGMEYDLSPDDRTVVAALPGWPLALDVAAPGVPAPHDPELDAESAETPVLRPTDTSTWGPAQRRLGADEVALQWASWRAQIDDADFVQEGAEEGTGGEADATQSTGASDQAEDASPGNPAETGQPGAASDVDATSGPTGDGQPPEDDGDFAERPLGEPEEAASVATQDVEAAPGTGGATTSAEDAVTPSPDGTTDADPTPPGTEDGDDDPPAVRPHPGIRRALDEARTYLDNPPPPGRIRSAFATDAARTLRADGPGWSLVARTDDIAFLLLDEEPGEVLPVGRGAALPGLLESLDKIAVRPS